MKKLAILVSVFVILGLLISMTTYAVVGTAVTKVTFDKTSVTTVIGKTLTIKATVSPANATNKALNWTSSRSFVAKVSGTGLVTAQSCGTTEIRATAKDGSGVYASCTITVQITATQVQLYVWGPMETNSEPYKGTTAPAIIKAMEKITNVVIEWRGFKGFDRSNFRSLYMPNAAAAMAAGERVGDLFWETWARSYQPAYQGDPSKYINTVNTPNVFKYYALGNFAKVNFINLEGKISMPVWTWRRASVYKTGLAYVPFMRKDWCDACNIAVPKSWDTFMSALRMFKKIDCNGNGIKDEVPFYNNTQSGQHEERSTARGLRQCFENCTMYGVTWYWTDLGGKAYPMYNTINYRKMLQWYQDCVKEGIVGQYGSLGLKDMLQSGRLGGYWDMPFYLSSYKNAKLYWRSTNPKETWITLDVSNWTGPTGLKIMPVNQIAYEDAEAINLNKNCKFPEIAARWVDWTISDEAGEMQWFQDPKSYTVKSGKKVPAVAYWKEVLNTVDWKYTIAWDRGWFTPNYMPNEYPTYQRIIQDSGIIAAGVGIVKPSDLKEITRNTYYWPKIPAALTYPTLLSAADAARYRIVRTGILNNGNWNWVGPVGFTYYWSMNLSAYTQWDLLMTQVRKQGYDEFVKLETKMLVIAKQRLGIK